MPRKAKEKINELNMETTKLTDVVGEKKVKKTKSSTEKKPTKTRKKKVSVSEVTTITKESAKKTSTTKSKSTKKATATKKSATAKTSTNSSIKKSKTTKVINKTSTITTEYYDLPFRYNQTIVRILAQTPNTLFIYWDISDNDRQSYLEKYGADFFEATKPYLIITNATMHYTFEVEINDFANSWYLHINDANCEYKVELVRKFIVNSHHDDFISNTTVENSKDNAKRSANAKKFVPYAINDYLYITSSNEIEAPNDRILFDKLGSTVFFRNVKTNVTNKQDISSLSFLQKIGKVYNIYDLYKEIYRDELISDEFELNLPSSNSSSFS